MVHVLCATLYIIGVIIVTHRYRHQQQYQFGSLHS